MKNKVRVIFENKKVRFITYYTGDLNHLRDILHMSGGYTSAKILANKTEDSIYFPVLDEKWSSLDLIRIYYDFKYYRHHSNKKETENINLDIFKRIVEQFGFKVEDMSLVKEEN